MQSKGYWFRWDQPDGNTVYVWGYHDDLENFRANLRGAGVHDGGFSAPIGGHSVPRDAHRDTFAGLSGWYIKGRRKPAPLPQAAVEEVAMRLVADAIARSMNTTSGIAERALKTVIAAEVRKIMGVPNNGDS